MPMLLYNVDAVDMHTSKWPASLQRFGLVFMQVSWVQTEKSALGSLLLR